MAVPGHQGVDQALLDIETPGGQSGPGGFLEQWESHVAKAENGDAIGGQGNLRYALVRTGDSLADGCFHHPRISFRQRVSAT